MQTKHRRKWLALCACGALLAMPYMGAQAAETETQPEGAQLPVTQVLEEEAPQATELDIPSLLWVRVFPVLVDAQGEPQLDLDNMPATTRVGVNADAVLLTRPLAIGSESGTLRWMPIYWVTSDMRMQQLYEYADLSGNVYYGTWFSAAQAGAYSLGIVYEEQALTEGVWRATGQTMQRTQTITVAQPTHADMALLEATLTRNEDQTLTLAATGGAQDAAYEPVAGDTRYVPAYYQYNGGPLRFFPEGDYTATMAATATPVTLTVTYRLEQFDGFGWNAEGTTVRLYRTA